jgi:hypothetical protein
MIQSELSQRIKVRSETCKLIQIELKNSEYKLIYRYEISFFVFDIIEIECEFDYSIYGN